jgi:ribosomal protein S18 acetylase RimI-like enzyme
MLGRRPAVADDEPFLRTLQASALPEFEGWPDELRATFLAQQFEARRRGYEAAFPDSQQEVILLAELPVGAVWLDWSQEGCRIVDLAILPEHRRQGVGRNVLMDVLEEAGRAGVPARARIDRTNAASLALLRGLGFVETGGDEVQVEVECAPAVR